VRAAGKVLPAERLTEKPRHHHDFNLQPQSNIIPRVELRPLVLELCFRVPVKMPSQSAWQQKKSTIIALYHDANKPLHEVQWIMQKDHGFKAR